MMKKYNSKNNNAERITRTITTYRVKWQALNMETHETFTKFKDMSCRIEDNDRLEFVSCLYRDGDTDTTLFPLVRSNDDVTIEVIERKRQMTVAKFIEDSEPVEE